VKYSEKEYSLNSERNIAHVNIINRYAGSNLAALFLK